MHITDMAFQIDKVADLIIPEALMPERRFTSLFGVLIGFDDAAREAFLQISNPALIVEILFRQRPDHMDMVWQDDRGDGFKRVEAFHIARAFTQELRVPGQDGTRLIRQVEREIPGSAGFKLGFVRVHHDIQAKLGPIRQVFEMSFKFNDKQICHQSMRDDLVAF